MIKVQNGIATREPIPELFIGLLPESLVDLSWAHESLGYRDVAWYPEESGDGELPANSKWGAETLTVDEERKVVVVKHKVVKLTKAELAERDEAHRVEMTPLVDIERNRRINSPFEFEGVLYQVGPDDRENIDGSALMAFMAMMGGAQPDDYRWANKDKDFAWIALDNTRVLMDAPTVIDFGKAVAGRKDHLVNKGRDLKDMNPIPADFTDDKWW